MFVIPSRLSCAGRVVTRAGRTTLPRRDKVTKISFLCRWKAPSVVNMLKITMFIAMLAVTRSEPPVNSYLPPRTGTSGVNGGQIDLSTQYGTPDFGNGGGVNRNGGATSFSGPGNNGAGNGPSKLYGTPGGNARVNGQSRGNGFGDGQPSSSYGAPFGDFSEHGGNARPSNSYGVPIANGNNGGGFRNGGNGGKPSINYGVPDTNGNNGDSFRNQGNGERPSTSYGVPGANGNHGGGSGRNNGNGRPSSSYGAPANGHTNDKNRVNGGNNGGKLSSSYESPNVPKTNGVNGFGGTNGGLSSSYGPPNRNGHGNNGYPSESPTRNGGSFGNGDANGYPSGGSTNAGNFENGGGSFKNGGRGSEGYNNNAQEESTEPAKYEFSYEVKDEQSGSNYGHTETRNGDRAQGEFNVLLPDGRKQIVEYEADQDGFKPQIRYEGEANMSGGYNSGGPNGNNDGYSSGRPESKSGGFADNSGFNGGGSNGYPNGGPGEGKSNGFNGGGGNTYQSGKSAEQSFSRAKDSDSSGNVNGFFSNAPSNNIGGNTDNNRQNVFREKSSIKIPRNISLYILG